MKKLIHRKCPNCASDHPVIMFKLLFEQFVTANPTHNLDWFKSLCFANETEFKFVKCANCNFVYSQVKLNNEFHHDFYHKGIDQSKSLKKIYSIEKKQQILLRWQKLLSYYSKYTAPNIKLSEKEIKVLDFGAGWGDFLSTIASPGIKAVGLEFDSRKINFAKSLGIQLGDFHFIKKNAPYDIFICNQVLEHLDKPRKSLDELKGLLVKNAVGFIGVPDFNSKRLDFFINKINNGEKVIKEINPWGHLNYFTPLSLRDMLFESGFTEIYGDYEFATNFHPKESLMCNLSSLSKVLYRMIKTICSFKSKCLITQKPTTLYIRNT